MKKTIVSTFILLVASFGLAQAQETKEQVTFRFVAGNDMLFSPWNGNGENLARLTEFITTHKETFVLGEGAIYVNGYCATTGNTAQRLQRAKTMSNRVKSELITCCGLTEQHFITQNVATAYEGQKNIVVVTVTIPAQQAESKTEKPEVLPPEQPKQELQELPMEQAKQEPEPQPEPAVALSPASATTTRTVFNLRTNLLYWAAATPNIGLQWRITPSYGIKIDGGYSKWEYNGENKIQKLWFINPEVRRYMLENKRFYMGLGATLGEYNLKLGSTGYQGSVYGGALTVGYQLSMGRHFSCDFNIGLGAAHLTYDTFGVIDGVRVFKAKKVSKTIFGPTQIGVSLIWHISHPSLKRQAL